MEWSLGRTCSAVCTHKHMLNVLRWNYISPPGFVCIIPNWIVSCTTQMALNCPIFSLVCVFAASHSQSSFPIWLHRLLCLWVTPKEITSKRVQGSGFHSFWRKQPIQKSIRRSTAHHLSFLCAWMIGLLCSSKQEKSNVRTVFTPPQKEIKCLRQEKNFHSLSSGRVHSHS